MRIVETKRLLLRTLEIEDIDSLMRVCGFNPPYDHEYIITVLFRFKSYKK